MGCSSGDRVECGREEAKTVVVVVVGQGLESREGRVGQCRHGRVRSAVDADVDNVI